MARTLRWTTVATAALLVAVVGWLGSADRVAAHEGEHEKHTSP